MKVTFTHKSGRQQSMPERMARTLQRIGRGTYMTRDMAAASVAAAPAVVPAAPDVPVAPVAVDLESMDVDALRALAEERGVKVHHKAGAEKIRAALEAAQ